MKFGGFSFHSQDVIRSVGIYHGIFGWEILSQSKNHGEMRILPLSASNSSEVKLFWSPISGKCPTNPGTMTLLLSEQEKIQLLLQDEWKKEFLLEYNDDKHDYSSWLDQNKNRVWLYVIDSKSF